jgi:DNA-binding MarR family transcriptional regulator
VPRLPFDPIDEARRQWDRRWGGEAVPAMAAVTSIMRAERILMARLNERLLAFDLTFPRYEALMLLLYTRRGELPLGKVSARLQVHRASVTNVVDKLAASGFVERVPHDGDRRAVLARITDAGRRTAEEATAALHADGFGMSPLGDADCEDLFRLLRPLRESAGDFGTA